MDFNPVSSRLKQFAGQTLEIYTNEFDENGYMIGCFFVNITIALIDGTIFG